MDIDVELIGAREPAEVARAAERATEVLRLGGLVLHPTETVYGLGGDGSAANNELIARVKAREVGQPLILLTPDRETLMASFPAACWPDEAERLAQAFWPGPLTLVIPCDSAAAGLLGPDGGLAVRVSPDPVVGMILRSWGRPMTSTSANRSGRPPARTASEALALFEDRAHLGGVEPVLAVDGGPRMGGRPSTIVSLVGTPPRLLREGPIGRAAIRERVPTLEYSVR